MSLTTGPWHEREPLAPDAVASAEWMRSRCIALAKADGREYLAEQMARLPITEFDYTRPNHTHRQVVTVQFADGTTTKFCSECSANPDPASLANFQGMILRMLDEQGKVVARSRSEVLPK